MIRNRIRNRKLIILLFIVFIACMACMNAAAHAEAVFDYENNDNDKTKFELDNGLLEVEFAGITRDVNAKGEARDCVFTWFLVKAARSMKLEVKSDFIFDSLGRKFDGPVGISIAGSGEQSELIAGVNTLIWIVHKVPVAVSGELPLFALMNFWFNNNRLELNSRMTEAWEDWTQRLAGNKLFAAWFETDVINGADGIYAALQSAHYQVGSKIFDGHHYKIFVDEKISWRAAEAKCRAMGGHLAVITSQREQDFIDSIYDNKIDAGVWIGLFKPGGFGDKERFRWLDDEPLIYTRWADGNPVKDYYHDNTDGLHHWVYMLKDKNKKTWWANWLNETKLYYLCEWDF